MLVWYCYIKKHDTKMCLYAVYYVMINSTENKAGEVEVVYYYAEWLGRPC